MPDVDIAIFPYVHLAAGVVTVIISVWLLIKSQKTTEIDKDMGSIAQINWGGTQIFLGGMFKEITDRLDRITDAAKDTADSIKVLDDRNARLTERLYEMNYKQTEVLQTIENRTASRMDETQRLYRDIIDQLQQLRTPKRG